MNFMRGLMNVLIRYGHCKLRLIPIWLLVEVL